MDKSDIMARVSQLGSKVLQGMGLELVNVELGRQRGGWFLRYFIDKPGGVTLEDCQMASRQLGAELDVADAIPEHYRLEVSSPGLDRPLRTKEDFIRFTGRLLVIHTYEPVQGKRHFVGVLKSFADGVASLVDAQGQPWQIPMGIISKARLEIEP